MKSIIALLLLLGILPHKNTAAAEPQPALPRCAGLVADKKPVNVVLYGDSISEIKGTWAGGARGANNNWGAVLTQKLGAAFPGSAFTVAHFAIGGQNTYEGLGRLDWLAAYKPDLVLVAFGANDCSYHYLIPEETQLAATTLCTEIRKRYGADVVLVGTGGDCPQKPFFKHLDETLAAQKAAAKEANVPYVDTRSAILTATEGGKKWAEYHFNEGNCHPTNLGHVVWAQAAFNVVLPLLQAPNAPGATAEGAH